MVFSPPSLLSLEMVSDSHKTAWRCIALCGVAGVGQHLLSREAPCVRPNAPGEHPSQATQELLQDGGCRSGHREAPTPSSLPACVRCMVQLQELLLWLEPLRRDDKTGKLVVKVTDRGGCQILTEACGLNQKGRGGQKGDDYCLGLGSWVLQLVSAEGGGSGLLLGFLEMLCWFS